MTLSDECGVRIGADTASEVGRPINHPHLLVGHIRVGVRVVGCANGSDRKGAFLLQRDERVVGKQPEVPEQPV